MGRYPDYQLRSCIRKECTYLGGFLDLSTNGLGNKLGNQLLQLGSLGLTTHDLGHLATDGLDLGRLSVGGLLDLVGGSLGETNGE